MDHEEVAAEKIKATFEIMGFSIEDNNIPKGQMVFSKKLARLRPPQYKNSKRFGTSRKTYFDEDGSPILEVVSLDIASVNMVQAFVQLIDYLYRCKEGVSFYIEIVNSMFFYN